MLIAYASDGPDASGVGFFAFIPLLTVGILVFLLVRRMAKCDPEFYDTIERNENYIAEFPTQNLWGMIGLASITCGLYFPFWLRKHTKIVNKFFAQKSIGNWWFPASLTVAALCAGMVKSGIVTSDNPTAGLISTLDIILLAGWAFKIRNRMIILLGAQKGDHEWYNAFWTLIFGAFYLQSKINSRKKDYSKS
jgi:hypothetical protein